MESAELLLFTAFGTSRMNRYWLSSAEVILPSRCGMLSAEATGRDVEKRKISAPGSRRQPIGSVETPHLKQMPAFEIVVKL